MCVCIDWTEQMTAIKKLTHGASFGAGSAALTASSGADATVAGGAGEEDLGKAGWGERKKYEHKREILTEYFEVRLTWVSSDFSCDIVVVLAWRTKWAQNWAFLFYPSSCFLGIVLRCLTRSATLFYLLFFSMMTPSCDLLRCIFHFTFWASADIFSNSVRFPPTTQSRERAAQRQVLNTGGVSNLTPLQL